MRTCLERDPSEVYAKGPNPYLGKGIPRRDGKRVGGEVLFRADNNAWSGLKDVNFRVGQFGRLEFTIDGEEYYLQYMPVGMQQIVAPPELMLAQMQYAGVDHCVLQAGWGYGAMNDYNLRSSQYPTWFTALLNVDEPRAAWRGRLPEFDRAYRQLGLKGVYFALDIRAVRLRRNVDDAIFDAFWSHVELAGLPVFIELHRDPGL